MAGQNIGRKTRQPNAFELEILRDLDAVQKEFLAGKVKAGTIRSKVLHRMASRRGRTMPAPEAGLTQTDHLLSGKFSRAVSRLVSMGLVAKKGVGDTETKSRPYQWGFARHAKRDHDLFLTRKGMEAAAQAVAERERRGASQDGEEAAAQAAEERAPQAADGHATDAAPQPGAGAHEGAVGRWTYVSGQGSAVKREEAGQDSYVVNLGSMRVTYTVTRKKEERR